MANKRKNGKRKKKRTHVKPTEEEILSIPRSVVIPWGKTARSTRLIKQLVHDWRKVMAPHTAKKLQVVKQNKISDFIKHAKGIHYTHVILFTKTERAPYFKIARVPDGPSVSFQVQGFTLAQEIRKALKIPLLPQQLLANSPLVVMNNFHTPNLKLVSSLIQNMFPPINVHSVRLAECRRVLLFNYHTSENIFEVRHYQVRTSVTSRRGAQTEDAETTYTDKTGNKQKKIKVFLEELGPRLSLRLHKVQDGPFSGETLHHEFKHYTPEELGKIQKDMKRKKDLKVMRRKEQERNVQRKKEEQEKKKQAQKEAEAEQFEIAEKGEEAALPKPMDDVENGIEAMDLEDERMMGDAPDEDEDDELDIDDDDDDEEPENEGGNDEVGGMEDVELDEKDRKSVV